MISGAGESGGLLWATTGMGGGGVGGSRIVHCYWQERLAALLLHRLKISSILSSVQQVRALYLMHAGRIVAIRNTSRNLPVLPIAFLVGIISWSANCFSKP